MQAIYGKSSQKMPLTAFQWGLAFDVFAIAAAATGMLPYAVAVTHKLVCKKVGHEARGPGIKANLGVVYDEVCKTSSVITLSYIYLPGLQVVRRNWATRTGHGEKIQFHVEACVQSAAHLATAEAICRAGVPQRPQEASVVVIYLMCGSLSLFAAGQLCTAQQPQE